MKVKLLVVCLIVAFIIGGVAPTRAIAQTEQAKGIPPSWLNVNPDGFGDNNWWIASLEDFGQYLYAGTFWADLGTFDVKGQIWRSDDDENWEKVFEADVDTISVLTVFKEELYAGSFYGIIWRSKDGLVWEEVVSDRFGNASNGIVQMAVYNNNLYASTWNWETGAEIWRTRNGKDWELFLGSGLNGDPNNVGAICSEIFKGQLYWGTSYNWATGGQIWRTNGITSEAVVSDGFGDPMNANISALATFGSELYAAVGNFNDGHIEIWRSYDGTNWEQAYKTSGPDYLPYIGMEVYREDLYVVMGHLTGIQVWRTHNGAKWEQVGFEGFGDANNNTTFFDNSTTIYRGGLYIGTVNYGSGPQVWKLIP